MEGMKVRYFGETSNGVMVALNGDITIPSAGVSQVSVSGMYMFSEEEEETADYVKRFAIEVVDVAPENVQVNVVVAGSSVLFEDGLETFPIPFAGQKILPVYISVRFVEPTTTESLTIKVKHTTVDNMSEFDVVADGFFKHAVPYTVASEEGFKLVPGRKGSDRIICCCMYMLLLVLVFLLIKSCCEKKGSRRSLVEA